MEFNTLSGQHILVHVWEFVTRDVVIINGVPHSLRTNYRSFRPLAQDWKGRGELYVHPETGILGVARPQPRKKPQPKQDYLCIDRYHQYHKIEDIWYLVYFRDLPRSTVTTTGKTLPIKVKDVLQRKYVTYPQYSSCDYPTYAYSKRQCNKKQIKWIKAQLARNQS